MSRIICSALGKKSVFLNTSESFFISYDEKQSREVSLPEPMNLFVQLNSGIVFVSRSNNFWLYQTSFTQMSLNIGKPIRIERDTFSHERFFVLNDQKLLFCVELTGDALTSKLYRADVCDFALSTEIIAIRNGTVIQCFKRNFPNVTPICSMMAKKELELFCSDQTVVLFDRANKIIANSHKPCLDIWTPAILKIDEDVVEFAGFQYHVDKNVIQCALSEDNLVVWSDAISRPTFIKLQSKRKVDAKFLESAVELLSEHNQKVADITASFSSSIQAALDSVLSKSRELSEQIGVS